MCGRTGLSLDQQVVQSACVYKRSSDEKHYVTPVWSNEYNLGKEYSPSYNIAPTEVTPVLVSASNFGYGESEERILKPMMWGMIPRWHKGNPKSHGLSTNNCRVESILSSKLYRTPLSQGNRCVVLAEGFYEWQTANSSKQPYYIYAPQTKGTKMYELSSFDNTFDSERGWNGINLLKMAGLYDEWTCDEGVIFSYSVITMEANTHFNWLHHRIPAVLETEQELNDWLDADRVSQTEAVKSLKPSTILEWYPVSTLVNSSKEKSPSCRSPIDPSDMVKPDKKRSFGSKSIMQNWLKSSNVKKPKIEG